MTRYFGRIALVGTLLAVTPAVAEVGRYQSDFTFKRVAVPAAGTQRRITVQIEPKPFVPPAPAAPRTENQTEVALAAPATSDRGARTPAGTDWFWVAVSPRAADSGPGRLDVALREIANAPRGSGVATPRLQSMQEIARLHGADILRATVGTKVSPALVLAVISVESAGRGAAVSSAGAQGLMQLMPATAARFGVRDSFVTSENIRGGVAYLDWLMKHFGGDPILALAGYNAGEGAVARNGGVPPYAETRAYVPKALAAFNVARAMCQTPPVLVSDGCVFSISNL
jgi:soluble lytic murein transglycosylase-like protein